MTQQLYIVHNGNGTHVADFREVNGAMQPILGSGPEQPPAKLDRSQAANVAAQLRANAAAGNRPDTWTVEPAK